MTSRNDKSTLTAVRENRLASANYSTDGRVNIVLPATLHDERYGQPDALAQEHDDQQEDDQRDA